jgi:hypothetical protein
MARFLIYFGNRRAGSASASVSPSVSASVSRSASVSPSVSPSAPNIPEAPIVWGHVTGVTEPTIETFAGNWTGTGTISGSGDAEKVTLASGEVETSNVVHTGARSVLVKQNFYVAGDTVLLEYRDGATEAACLAASWNTYSAPFTSAGFVQVRLTSTL